MIKIMAWIGYIGGILVCGVVLAGGCGRQYRQPYEIMVERETVKDVGRCRRDENCMDFKVFNGTTKGE